MRSLFREFVVGKQRRDDAHDRDMLRAWLPEALHRQKRLPELKTLLIKREQKKQNLTQMKTKLHQIAEHYGLKVRKRGRRGA